MKRRAFLQQINGQYLDDFVYISWYPLYNRGFEIVCFDSDDQDDIHYTLFEKHKPTCEDIIIGSVEATTKFFQYIGVEVPSYLGYPEELKPYLLRNVDRIKFGEINRPYPYFVKPADDVKGFTGALIDSNVSRDMLYDYNPINSDTNVWVSDPIEFISEYRCFVHNGKLEGIKHYSGDFKIFPNVDKILEMIKAYTTSNVAYTLDVGITDKGETALVEINDMWAIGSYGFDSTIYVRMCIDRMREIINKKLEYIKVLEDLKNKIKSEFPHFEVLVSDNEIIIEEDYDMSEDEKNDDDCYDRAKENGESVIDKFPMLEISNYYCHRHKYAIVNLKIITN